MFSAGNVWFNLVDLKKQSNNKTSGTIISKVKFFMSVLEGPNWNATFKSIQTSLAILPTEDAHGRSCCLLLHRYRRSNVCTYCLFDQSLTHIPSLIHTSHEHIRISKVMGVYVRTWRPELECRVRNEAKQYGHTIVARNTRNFGVEASLSATNASLSATNRRCGARVTDAADFDDFS